MEQIPGVYEAAESSDGFVDRSGRDSALPWGEVVVPACFHDAGDPRRVAATLSLWEDLEAVAAYAYQGPHGEAMKRRNEWFTKQSCPTYVAWWVEDGHQPTYAEGADRLEQLHTKGPTEHAFNFVMAFAPSGERGTIDASRVRGKTVAGEDPSESAGEDDLHAYIEHWQAKMLPPGWEGVFDASALLRWAQDNNARMAEIAAAVYPNEPDYLVREHLRVMGDFDRRSAGTRPRPKRSSLHSWMKYSVPLRPVALQRSEESASPPPRTSHPRRSHCPVPTSTSSSLAPELRPSATTGRRRTRLSSRRLHATHRSPCAQRETGTQRSVVMPRGCSWHHGWLCTRRSSARHWGSVRSSSRRHTLRIGWNCSARWSCSPWGTSSGTSWQRSACKCFEANSMSKRNADWSASATSWVLHSRVTVAGRATLVSAASVP